MSRSSKNFEAPLIAPAVALPICSPLLWISQAVSGATRYELGQQLNGGSWSTIHNAAGTSEALSGQGNSTWGYRVQACNSGGCGPYSATRSTVVTLRPSGGADAERPGLRQRAGQLHDQGAYSALHTVWVDNVGGCNPPFCEQPDSVPADSPGSW